MRRLALVTMLTVMAGCAHVPAYQAPIARPLPAVQAQTLQGEGLFPVKQGHAWLYASKCYYLDDPYTLYDGSETVEIESVRRQGGTTTLEMRAIDDYTHRYRFPVISQGPEGVRISGVTYFGPSAKEAPLTIEFLKLPLVPGKKWDDGQWVGEVKGKETVKVLAGTFETWKVGAIGTFDNRYTAVGNYWITPGVGIIKSDLTLNGIAVESQLEAMGRGPLRRRR